MTTRISGAHLLEGFVSSITEAWSQRACEFDKHGLEPGAKLIRTLIAELSEQSSHYLAEPLTLESASKESGYSPDHLARLVRKGILKNLGKKGAPRVSRRELPIRPALAQPALRLQLAPTSRHQVARSLIRKRG